MSKYINARGEIINPADQDGISPTNRYRKPDEEPAVKYPAIRVKLVGTDGNAFAVLGAVNKALRQGGVSQAERDEFMAEATSAGYDHLLATCMRWVVVL